MHITHKSEKFSHFSITTWAAVWLTILTYRYWFPRYRV